MTGKTSRVAIWLFALAALPACHASTPICTITTSRLCTALIVEDGTLSFSTHEGRAVANLTGLLTGANYTVTKNSGVPSGSLTYTQIWDIRYQNTTPLSGADISAYVTYMAGGGSLFVMGENTAEFLSRDNSIVSLVQSAGGGTLSLTNPVTRTPTFPYISPQNPQTVISPFSTTPNPVPTFFYAAAAAGVLSPPGTGAFITVDSNNVGSAIVFGPGMMTNAPAGSLEIVFDVNFLDPQTNVTDPSSQAFTINLIQYLTMPAVLPPAPPSTPAASGAPTLSEWGMILLACGLIFVATRKLRVPTAAKTK